MADCNKDDADLSQERDPEPRRLHVIEAAGHSVVVHDLTWTELKALAKRQRDALNMVDVLDTVADHLVSIDGDAQWRESLPARETGPILSAVNAFFGAALKPPASGDS